MEVERNCGDLTVHQTDQKRKCQTAANTSAPMVKVRENTDLRSPPGRSHRHKRIIRVHELACGTGLSASRLRYRSLPWYFLLMTTRALSCTLSVVVPSL